MKKILLIWWLLLPLLSFGQEKLNKLVSERETLHRQWQEAESRASGIFGNRTKKDMIATNEWLERIVQKDNEIIAELELLKKIETAELGYEKEDYKFIAQKQEQDIGKLKRALAEKDKEIAAEKSNKRVYEWTTLVFFLSTVTLGYFFNKVKFKRNQTLNNHSS